MTSEVEHANKFHARRSLKAVRPGRAFFYGVEPMTRKKKRKTWDKYEDYLQSEEWQAIRKEVHLRDVICQMCASESTKNACHHWRYPKNWNDDDASNVVLLCVDCHSSIHEFLQGNEIHDYVSFPIFVYHHMRQELSDALLLAGRIARSNGLRFNKASIGNLTLPPTVVRGLEHLSEGE
jgi:hypothetical protein